MWSTSSVVGGLCLAGVSSLLSAHCDPGIPCFDAAYRVEFVERLPESTCDDAWADNWTFAVKPVGTEGGEHCGIGTLELVEPNLPRSVVPGGLIAAVATIPDIRTGSVDGSYPVEASDGCTARVSLHAWMPQRFRDVAAAAAEEAVIWEASVDQVNEACGVAIPESGNCSEYYRTRMTKVADLDAAD